MARIYVKNDLNGLSSNFYKGITNNYSLEKEEISYPNDKDKTITKKSEFLECARINFFIGQNNSGKSRFLRALISSPLLAWYEGDKGNICFAGNESGDYPRGLNKPEGRIDVVDKVYIPILRGLRPIVIEENKDSDRNEDFPYVNRTKKDYFNQMIQIENTDADKFINNKEFFDWKKNRTISFNLTISTGETIQKQIIEMNTDTDGKEKLAAYVKAVENYFFNGSKFGIIEKPNDTDVIKVTIGNEHDKCIYDLGDGIQQILILTFEAFMAEKRMLFFIEEPEIHFHPGMLRQLMNFYLDKTEHYYFFTTHSNHLLDMVNESDEVVIQKFIKLPKNDTKEESKFEIHRCGQRRDRDLLDLLGVKPSSVYLANCTIWVEGITDRLYIVEYMKKYLKYLEQSDQPKYKRYNEFLLNYHYSFIEYAGANLVHWNFDDVDTDADRDKGLNAKAITSEMLLIADGDIASKGDRLQCLINELGKENIFLLGCKEIENTLPFEIIKNAAMVIFERKKEDSKKGFSIGDKDKANKLDRLEKTYFYSKEFGIGKLLDDIFRNKLHDLDDSSADKTLKDKTLFADGTGVGTIKEKLKFCKEVTNLFKEEDWDLTDEAKELCKRIFEHIERCNQ
jgi:hypothetical protein